MIRVVLKLPDTPLFKGDPAELIADHLYAGMEKALTLLKEEAQVRATRHVNTGVLREGVSTGITVSLAGEPVELRGRLFDPVSYFPPVELGGRPHWPPRGPIEEWVSSKLKRVPASEVRSVAFLIARKISRQGTPARRYFAQAWAASEGRVRGYFEEARDRIAAALSGR